MATSDLPHEDDEARDAIADAYRDHLKHQPNSWVVTSLTPEPRCVALQLPIPDPIVPYQLNLNDRRFLHSIKIAPDR